MSYGVRGGPVCSYVGCPAPWRPRSGKTSASLASTGSSRRGTVHWNPSTSQLYTHALTRGEGRLAEGGPLAVDTGKHTGRSPKDKFVVREPGSEERIWWGDVNAEISEEHFEGLREKVAAHLGGDDDLYVVDAFAGADPSTGSPSASSRAPVPRALRADDVHRPDRGRAARLRAAGARPARARARVRPRRRRHAQRHVRRPPPVARGGADRRHVLRRRDQEVDLHADERPPAARGRLPDALLGERRRRRRRRDLLRPLAAPARRRSRPTPSAR